MSIELDALFADSVSDPQAPVVQSLDDQFDNALGVKRSPKAPAYRVKRIIDGDTIQLTDYPVPVRLSGVNTPEDTKVRQRGGVEATARLQQLTAGRQVRVQVRDRDKYGRDVADLYAEGDATSLNQQLLSEGYGSSLDKGLSTGEFSTWATIAASSKATGLGIVKGVMEPVSAFFPVTYEGVEKELLKNERALLAQATAAGFTGAFARYGSMVPGFAGEMAGMLVPYAPMFKIAHKVFKVGQATTLLGKLGRQTAAATLVGGITGITAHVEDGVSPAEGVLKRAAAFGVGEVVFAPLMRKAWKGEIGAKAETALPANLQQTLSKFTSKPVALEDAASLLDKVRVGQNVTPVEAQAVIAASRETPGAVYSPVTSQAAKILESHKVLNPDIVVFDEALRLTDPAFGARLTFSEGGKAMKPIDIALGEGPLYGRYLVGVRDMYFAALSQGRTIALDKIEVAHAGAYREFRRLWSGASPLPKKPIIPKATMGTVGEHGVVPAAGDTVTVQAPGKPATQAKVVEAPSALEEPPPDFAMDPQYQPKLTGDPALDEIIVRERTWRQGVLVTNAGRRPNLSPELLARSEKYRAAAAAYPGNRPLPKFVPENLEFAPDALKPAAAEFARSRRFNVVTGKMEDVPLRPEEPAGPLHPLYVGTSKVPISSQPYGPGALSNWKKNVDQAFAALGQTVNEGNRRHWIARRRDVVDDAERLLLPTAKTPEERTRIQDAIKVLRRPKAAWGAPGDVLENQSEAQLSALRPGMLWVMPEGSTVPVEVPYNHVVVGVRVPLGQGANFRTHSDGTSRIAIVDTRPSGGVVVDSTTPGVHTAGGRELSWETLDDHHSKVREVFQEVDWDPVADTQFPRLIVESYEGNVAATISLVDVRQELIGSHFGVRGEFLPLDLVEGTGTRRLHQEPYAGKGTPKLATGDSIMDPARPTYTGHPPAGTIPFKMNETVKDWAYDRKLRLDEGSLTEGRKLRYDARTERENRVELGARPSEGVAGQVVERALFPRERRVPVFRSSRAYSPDLPEPANEIQRMMQEEIEWKSRAGTGRGVQTRYEEDLAARGVSADPTEMSAAEYELAVWEPQYTAGPNMRVQNMTRSVKVVERPWLVSRDQGRNALGRELASGEQGKLGVIRVTEPSMIRARDVARLAIERGADPSMPAFVRMANDGVHVGAIENGLPLTRDVKMTLGEIADIRPDLMDVREISREAAHRGLKFVPQGRGGTLIDPVAGTEHKFEYALEALDHLGKIRLRPELAPKVEMELQNSMLAGWSNSIDPDVDSNLFRSVQMQDLATAELLSGKRTLITAFSTRPGDVKSLISTLEYANKFPASTFATVDVTLPELGDRKLVAVYNKALALQAVKQNGPLIRHLTGFKEGGGNTMTEIITALAKRPGGLDILGRDPKQAGLYAVLRMQHKGADWREGVLQQDALGTYRAFDNVDARMKQVLYETPRGAGDGEGNQAPINDIFGVFKKADDSLPEDLDELVSWPSADHGYPEDVLEPPPSELLDLEALAEYESELGAQARADLFSPENLAQFDRDVPQAAGERMTRDLPILKRLALRVGVPAEIFKMLQTEFGLPFYTTYMRTEGGRLAAARFLDPRIRQMRLLAKGLTNAERDHISLMAEGKMAETPGWREHWKDAGPKLSARADAYIDLLQKAAVDAGYETAAIKEILGDMPRLRLNDGEYHAPLGVGIPSKLQSLRKVTQAGRGLTMNERNLDFHAVGMKVLRTMSNEKLLGPAYDAMHSAMLPLLRPAKDGGVPGIPEAARRLVWSYLREVQHIPDGFTVEMSAIANKGFKKLFGKNPFGAEGTLDVISMLTGANAAHNMAFQPGLLLRNLFQTALNIPHLGLRYTYEGLQMAGEWAAAKGGRTTQTAFMKKYGITDLVKFAEDRGIVSGVALSGPLRESEMTIQNIVAGDAGKTLGKAFEYLEYGTMPYKFTDDFNRIATWWGQYRKFMDAAEVLKSRKMGWGEFVTRSGLDFRDDSELGPLWSIVEKNVKTGLSTGDHSLIERAGRLLSWDMANSTQFMYTRGNVPLILQSGAGRLFGQYGVWSGGYLTYLRGLSRGVSKERKVGAVAAFIGTNYVISKVMQDAFGVDFARWLWAAPLGYTGSPAYQIATGAVEVGGGLLSSPFDVDPATGIPFPKMKDPMLKMGLDRLLGQATQYIPIPSTVNPGGDAAVSALQEQVPPLGDWPTTMRTMKKLLGRPGRLWQTTTAYEAGKEPADVFRTFLGLPKSEKKIW